MLPLSIRDNCQELKRGMAYESLINAQWAEIEYQENVDFYSTIELRLLLLAVDCFGEPPLKLLRLQNL